jgi:hypothetical protein
MAKSVSDHQQEVMADVLTAITVIQDWKERPPDSKPAQP